ncbi:MAG: inositol monophosphatase family protein [candidate division WOR-3 bacterium]
MLREIIEVAKKAGILLKNYFGLLDGEDIQRKKEGHFVTKADKESEEFIVKELVKKFPGVGICSEERELIPGKGTFFVDPLDGTHNFIHKISYFCVSIAYVEGSEIKIGVIYAPIFKELFYAEKGKGAFFNGRRIEHSKEKEISRALISISIPSSAYNRREEIFNFLKELIVQVNSLRMFGSAALQLADTARGKIDGNLGFSLSPWDVSAGVLLVREAGGLVTNEKGGNEISDGNIISGTPYIQKFLLDFIKNKVNK